MAFTYPVCLTLKVTMGADVREVARALSDVSQRLSMPCECPGINGAPMRCFPGQSTEAVLADYYAQFPPERYTCKEAV